MINENAVRACPICGGIKTNRILKYECGYQYFDKFPQIFDVVTCDNCGFIYYDIDASQEIFDEYYCAHSVYENLGIAYGKVDQITKKVYEDRALEISSILTEEDEILEIGSANGFLLDELKKLGYKRLNALDLSKRCLEFLQAKGYQTYYGGIFSDLEHLWGKFDCICLTQVLEHIYDIQGAIRRMKKMLKPGGRLYIEVPDAEKYSKYASQPYSFLNFEHICHFDAVSLSNLAKATGLEVENIYSKSIKFNTKSGIVPCVVGILGNTQMKKSTSKSLVQRYIMDSEECIKKKIEALDLGQQEVAVWGIGTTALQLIKQIQNRWNITYLIDSNPIRRGTFAYNLSIDTPDRLVKVGFQGTILIATAFFTDEVIQQISDLNLRCSYIKLFDFEKEQEYDER